MASPATPGLFFCFFAMVLLIIVRAKITSALARQLKFPTYVFNRYLYLHQPGTAYISSVHSMGESTIILVCSVILERKHD